MLRAKAKAFQNVHPVISRLTPTTAVYKQSQRTDGQPKNQYDHGQTTVTTAYAPLTPNCAHAWHASVSDRYYLYRDANIFGIDDFDTEAKSRGIFHKVDD